MPKLGPIREPERTIRAKDSVYQSANADAGERRAGWIWILLDGAIGRHASNRVLRICEKPQSAIRPGCHVACGWLAILILASNSRQRKFFDMPVWCDTYNVSPD